MYCTLWKRQERMELTKLIVLTKFVFTINSLDSQYSLVGSAMIDVMINWNVTG